MKIDRHECQSCGFMGREEELVNPIPDLEQRVGPGEAMPSGECPACGAVCHPTKRNFPAPVRIFASWRDGDGDGYCNWFQTDLAAAEDKDAWLSERPDWQRDSVQIDSFPPEECTKKRRVESPADLLKLVAFVYNSCETEGCSDGTATISAEAYDRLKAVCGE